MIDQTVTPDTPSDGSTTVVASCDLTFRADDRIVSITLSTVELPAT